jgi:hypothetical protein
MLFSTGFPVSFDAVIAIFRTTNSLLPPIDIGLAGIVCVAVYVTESGPSGGMLWAWEPSGIKTKLNEDRVRSARKNTIVASLVTELSI